MPPKRKRKDPDASPEKDAAAESSKKKESKEDKKKRIQLERAKAKKWSEQRKKLALAAKKKSEDAADSGTAAGGGGDGGAAGIHKTTTARMKSTRKTKPTRKVKEAIMEDVEEEAPPEPKSKRRRISKPVEKEKPIKAKAKAKLTSKTKATAKLVEKEVKSQPAPVSEPLPLPVSVSVPVPVPVSVPVPVPVQLVSAPASASASANANAGTAPVPSQGQPIMSPIAIQQPNGSNIVYVPVNVASYSIPSDPPPIRAGASATAPISVSVPVPVPAPVPASTSIAPMNTTLPVEVRPAPPVKVQTIATTESSTQASTIPISIASNGANGQVQVVVEEEEEESGAESDTEDQEQKAEKDIKDDIDADADADASASASLLSSLKARRIFQKAIFAIFAVLALLIGLTMWDNDELKLHFQLPSFDLTSSIEGGAGSGSASSGGASDDNAGIESVPFDAEPCFFNRGFDGDMEMEMEVVCNYPTDCPEHGRCQGGKLVDCLLEDGNGSPSSWEGGFYIPSTANKNDHHCVVSSTAMEAMLNLHTLLIDLTVEYVCRSYLSFASTCRLSSSDGDIMEDGPILFSKASVASITGMDERDMQSILNLMEKENQKQNEDIVQKVEIEDRVEKGYIGMSEDYTKYELPIPTACYLRILLWDLIRTVSALSYGCVVILANLLWSVATANPIPAFVVGITTYIILWIRTKRAKVAGLRKESSDIQKIAYDKLIMDCNEGEGYACLHLRDEISHDLHPEPCAARQRFNNVVWPRVIALIRADNRVTKSRKSIGGKNLEWLEWVADSSRKSRRSLAANGKAKEE